ncbi:MAG: N-6 DNA methylase [Chloracidobacterium sp.]|nr:N-6 DNA methylase [Chloracidobacterium sp.]
MKTKGAPDYKKEIIKTLERITASGVSAFDIFDDFLNISLASLERLPDHVRSIAQTGKPADDTKEVQKRFERPRERYRSNNKYYFDLFAEALGYLLLSAEDDWNDTIGDVYMEFGISNKHSGQFFTPFHLAKLMADLTVDNIPAQVHERIKAACRENPLAQAMLLTGLMIEDPDQAEAWFFNKVLPAVAPDIKPITVCDPACGSGVMFLAAASAVPRWMLDWNLVRFYGMDIDQTCVNMARLNILLHGLNGFSIKCALALSEVELKAIPDPYQSAYREAQSAELERLIEITEELRSWKQSSLL